MCPMASTISIDVRPVFGPQPDHAAPMKAALENFAVQRIGALEDDAGAGFQFLAGMHQRFPPVGLQPGDEEALDGAAARDAPADAAAPGTHGCC